MALKLTDKEVKALAQKVAVKKQTAIAAKNSDLAKAKLPQAKMIMATFNGLPEQVKAYIFDHRYSGNAINAENLAKALCNGSRDTTKVSPEDIEADIVLAAHSCTTLAQLCKKLGI